MRSCARETSANALKATLGTALGVALSLALVVVADADHWIYALVLPVGFFAAVFAAETSGLVAAQAAFAVTVIALFNLMKPSDWELGLVRLEDVLIGAVVGIAIGVAIWPRGAAGQLRAALGALLEQGAAYAAVAARGQLARSEPADAAESRERAVFSGRRAEDAFRAYLTERRPSGSQLRGWSNALVAGDRLWYTADRAAVRATDAPPPRPCDPLTGELEDGASRMEAGYRALARALVEGRDPPAPVPVVPSGLDEAAAACAHGALAGDGAAAAELLWVRYWLGDLFDGLRSASAGLAHADVP